MADLGSTKVYGDLQVTGDITGNVNGNAATATKLATARTINGVSFDGSTNITINAVDATARVASSEKGEANGVATLDAAGKVPATQLPSYVDDVLEFADQTSFPATGETGKIYIAIDTGKTYRWTGSVYADISANASTSDSATKLATARSISITGDATWSTSFDGSANVTGALTLANSGVTAGTYPKVTVDAKGRVTAGASMVEADVPALSIAKTTGLQAALDSKAASTDSRIVNGQTAYGWGNHASAGYVKVNTTYSAMSVAEGDAGTATTLRTMRSDYLRQIISKIPSVQQSAAYTATAADRGKGIDTTAPVTIPADTFNVGDVLVITNVGAGEFNISPDTGVVLRVAGTTNTGIVTLGAYGVVTLRLVSTNTWFVMGAGIK